MTRGMKSCLGPLTGSDLLACGHGVYSPSNEPSTVFGQVIPFAQTKRCLTIAFPIMYVPSVNSISSSGKISFLTKRKTLLLAVLVFIAAFSVRLYGLDRQTLECDELYTIPAATGHQYVYLSHEAQGTSLAMPLTAYEYKALLKPEPESGLRAVTAVLKRNVHLPGYFYLMHYWIRWFGISEFSLRLPAVIFGALAALMLLFLGKELFGLLPGVVSALLLALSPEQIYFSQQARMYSLLVLLAISSSYLLIKGGRLSESRWRYLCYALISIFGLYTHYEYAFCLAAQVFYVWLGSPLGREKPIRWLITQAGIALAFLPWVFITLAQKANSPEIIAWVNGSLTSNLILTEVVTKIARLVSVPELPLGWLSVIVAYALIIYGAVSIRSERAKLFLLLVWIIFPVAGVILMDKMLGTRAITITRYWLIVGPPLYLLISVGIAKIQKRPVRLALIAIAVGFMFSAALLTARGELRGKPDRHKEMSLYVDSQISGLRDQLVIAEGLNSLPLALAYYGQRDLEVMRFKWVQDQMKLRTFPDIIGRRNEVLLLVSGQSQATRLLTDSGYRMEGSPILYGHVNVAKYVRQNAASTIQR
jgi:uncharacterized membrane protein